VLSAGFALHDALCGGAVEDPARVPRESRGTDSNIGVLVQGARDGIRLCLSGCEHDARRGARDHARHDGHACVFMVWTSRNVDIAIE
jgi:hypothetical protein